MPENEPQSAGGGGAPAPAAASGGLAENVAGALCYLPIIAIIFLLIEPYNKTRFVRFHAFQSLFLCVASIGLGIVLAVIPILGWIMLPFVQLGIFIMAVIAAVKAYGKNYFKLPVIGNFAEKQAGA